MTRDAALKLLREHLPGWRKRGGLAREIRRLQPKPLREQVATALDIARRPAPKTETPAAPADAGEE